LGNLTGEASNRGDPRLGEGMPFARYGKKKIGGPRRQGPDEKTRINRSVLRKREI